MPRKSEATTHLRAYATSFVGRADELAGLQACFARGDRLVTVLGPGGVGKTRLAIQFASSGVSAHEGGVRFCELTDAVSIDGVCHAVGLALEVPLDRGADAAEAVAHLGAALARRPPTLVVLDNFDQAVRFASATVSKWLATAPRVRFLVTSRQRLRVKGEAVVDVGPLPLPAAAADAEQSEAVHLFVDRARAVRRGFKLATPSDHAAVAAIVRALDGLPLAIELAAARLRVMTLAELEGHLRQRLDLLTGGARDGHAREASLRGAIEWSWNLLDDVEKRALAQCGVFRGGFTLASAAAVLDVDAPVVDLLESLCDKSLVRAHEEGGEQAELRFRLYDSIRDYALERLEEGGRAGATRLRHARHYLALGTEEAERADGPAAAAARRRLLAELENIYAAHQLAMDAPLEPAERAKIVLGTALAVEPILHARGPNSIYLALFDAALAVAEEPGAGVPPASIVRGRLARAEARLRHGRVAEALADLAQAEAIARSLGDAALRARVLLRLGAWSWVQGYLKESAERYEHALVLAREAAHRASEGRALMELGRVRVLQGQIEEAGSLYEQSLRIQRELGDRPQEASVLLNLGILAIEIGNLAEARRRLTEAGTMARALDDLYTATAVQFDLASIDQEEGRFDEAVRRSEEAVAGFRALGKRQSEGLCMAFYGNVLEEAGRRDDARRVYEEAITICRDAKNELAEGLALGWLGRILADAGEIDASGRALNAGAELLERVGDRIRWEVVHLCGGHLELARARAAEAAGDPKRAGRHLREARRRARQARAPGAYAGSDVRAALRMLERAFPAAPIESIVPPPPPPRASTAPDGVLAVSSTGKWFRAPGGEIVRIEKRGALRLLMQKLASRRREQRGAASSVDDLFEAGWPGQRALPRAAASRVYVAMSTLRGMGLRDILQRHHDGYLLDPDVEIAIVDEPG